MATDPNDILKQVSDTGRWSAPDAYTSTTATPDITDTPPPAPQTWGQLGSDVGRLAIGATESQIGNVGRTLGYQQFGDDWNKSGQAWDSSISPGGQETTESPTWSGTWEHPIAKPLMAIGKQGAWNLPALIPGGGALAMGARAAIGGALGYTGAYGGIVDTIKSQPDDQLQKNSPTYMEIRKTHPEYEAKQILADQAWDNMGAAEKAAVVGTSALAGEAGPLSTVGKTITSAGGKTAASLASGRIAQGMIGAAETGGVQAGQYLGSAIPTRDALTSVGAPADTNEDIARGAIEQAGIGAVIGGGTRAIRQVHPGGENITGVPTSKMGGGTGGTTVDTVQPGQPDPAQASALKSAAQPTPEGELPFTYNRPNPPGTPPTQGPPDLRPTGPRTYQPPLPLNYDRPPSGTEPPPPAQPPIPPRQPPPFTVPPPGTQRPLGLQEGMAQAPQRQGELPLQPPERPVDQGALPGMAPQQPVTQLGLPGLGADVTHEPGETITRPPEAGPPKPPEPAPTTPTPAAPKVKLTKVSEPEPTAAAPEGIKDRIKETVDAHPTPDAEKAGTLKGNKAIQARAESIDDKITPEDKQAALALPKEDNPIKQYIVHANVLANSKVPTEGQVRNFLNAEKQVRDHLGGEAGGPEEPPVQTPKPPKPKPVSGGTKVSEPAKPTEEAPPKAAVGVEGAKGKEAPAAPAGKKTIKIVGGKAQLVEIPKGEAAPAPPPTKAEAKRQAAIDKLIGKKEAPTQVDRPTVEPTGEPKVTVVPPSDARLGGITPGEKAKAIAAKFAPKGETPPKAPTVVAKGLSQLKVILAKKAEGEEPTVTGKVAAAIKGVLTPKEKAIAAAAKLEEAKKNVHPNPTEAQKAAGNFKQGHPPASATQGQKVTIASAAGKVGQAVGKILGTAKNIPGKHLDVITHSSNDTGKVFVANEIDPKTSQFIRHVAITGANDVNDAFRTHYGMNSDRLGVTATDGKNIVSGIVGMTNDEFNHWKQTRNPEESVHPSTEGKHPLDTVDVRHGAPTKTLGSMTAKTAIQEALRKLPNEPKYMLYRKLAEQVMKYIPDVPVYNLRQPDLEKVVGKANAVYSPTLNQILMGTSSSHPELTLLHELMHAASIHLYNNNAKFKSFVDKITQEYKQGLPSLSGADAIMSSNVQRGGGLELLAELAKPDVQRQLAQIQMSDKLTNDLGMSAWAKATKTLWGGIVKAYKDGLEALGMKIPGRDDASKHTLLDGMLRLSDDAFMARSKQARTDFGNMRRAMDGHAESMDIVREQEHNSQQNINDTIHEAVEHPDSVQDHYVSEAKSLSDRVGDLVDAAPKGILKTSAYKYIVPFQGGDSFRMDKEGYFGPKTEANDWRKLNETNLKRDRDYSIRSIKIDNIVSDMYKQFRNHTRDTINNFGDMLGQATAFRFDPRHAIGEGANAWMAKAGWQWRNEVKQAQASADRLTKQYNTLPADLKQRFGQLVDAYHEAGIEQATRATDELIHSINTAGPKPLEELNVTNPDAKIRDRQEYIKFHNDWEKNWDTNQVKLKEHILNGELTENEGRWLAERGFDDINDIKNLANPRGPYVPLDHGGEFVINARYKVDHPTNGKLVEGTDNVFQFKTEAEAEAFQAKQPPNSNISTVHFNDEGKEVPKWEKWQKPDGTVGYAKDNQAWRVNVNDKYYSGHDGISAANRRYQQLKASGKFTMVSEPQSKQSGWYSGLQVSSPLFKHLMAEVDKRTDYTDAQKTAVKNLLKDAALSSMEGNRISKHMLPREAVAGWDTDYIKTFKKYFDAHNALMSRSKYAKDTSDSINAMIKYAKDNEGTSGATDRSLILNELNKRDNFFGSPNFLNDGGDNKLMGRVMKYAQAASFFWHMVSPGHLITHQTHQFLTYDMLAAKYGPMKAAAMAGRMHSIMAGTGFRNVTRSIPEMIKILKGDSKGLNFVEGLMDKMGQHPRYGADLTRMLNEAIATNRLHPDQGFDASVLHMGSSKVDRGLARLDLASRQTMGATEAYSRVWGYSLGYALARDAGETHEQAMRTAFDTVSRTQGLLSRSNMSSVMNKWYMKAPMQFKGWGINMMMTLAKSVHDVFAPDAPGVRAEAIRRLVYLFGSTAALTGINGLPSDPMRIGLALAGALDLTNYKWADAQDAMRKYFAENTSPAMANFLMDGSLASLGPFSFFGADRVGFGSLLVYGEPDDYTKGSLSDWVVGLMGGAPFEDLKIGAGIQAIRDGDYTKAITSFVPLKILNDWAKAWQGAYEGFPTKTGAPGMTPYSPGEAFMQAIGLTPDRKERWGEGREAEYRAEKTTRDEQTQLLDTLGRAKTDPDRNKARMQIAAYNLRNPDARISPQDVARAGRRQTAPSALGYTLSNRNRDRLQELERVYGSSL